MSFAAACAAPQGGLLDYHFDEWLSPITKTRRHSKSSHKQNARKNRKARK